MSLGAYVQVLPFLSASAAVSVDRQDGHVHVDTRDGADTFAVTYSEAQAEELLAALQNALHPHAEQVAS